jgi:hypothetical protein
VPTFTTNPRVKHKTINHSIMITNHITTAVQSVPEILCIYQIYPRELALFIVFASTALHGPGLPHKLLLAFLCHCWVPPILHFQSLNILDHMIFPSELRPSNSYACWLRVYFLDCPVIINAYNMSCPTQSVYCDIFDNVRLIKQLI